MQGGSGWSIDSMGRVVVADGLYRMLGTAMREEQAALALEDCRERRLVTGADAAALERKAGRNAGLLQRALTEHPDDPYVWYQLGKDHDVYRRHAEALDCFAQAESLLRSATPPWLHDLSVRRLHALKCCGRHAEGLDRAGVELECWTHSPDYHFALGDLLLDWAACEPHHASALLPMIERAWLRCLEIGERPDLEGAVQGRGSHLARHNLRVLHQFSGEVGGIGKPDPVNPAGQPA